MALPGSPLYGGSMDRVVDRALRDAGILTEAGFPGLMLENFGDSPFFPDDVPAVTVAAMSRVASEMKSVTPVPLGINVLRNDGLAAVAVAAAVDAAFVRINVLSGTMFTDQGAITGRAAEVARSRAGLAPGLTVLADVFVKHAAPPPGIELEQAAADTWERGGADALVVSGSGTGMATDLNDARRIRSSVPQAPLVVGSGVTARSLPTLAEIFDAAIVGSSIKTDGLAANPVDRARATDLISTAARLGFL